MAYTPPASNSIAFDLEAYSPGTPTAVNFELAGISIVDYPSAAATTVLSITWYAAYDAFGSSAGPASLVVSGFNAVSAKGLFSSASTASIGVTTRSSTDKVDKYSSAQSATCLLSGVSSVDFASSYSPAGVCSFEADGQSATGRIDKLSVAAIASNSITAFDAVGLFARHSQAGPGHYDISGFDAYGLPNINIASQAGIISFSLNGENTAGGRGVASLADTETLYLLGYASLLDQYIGETIYVDSIRTANVRSSVVLSSSEKQTVGTQSITSANSRAIKHTVEVSE